MFVEGGWRFHAPHLGSGPVSAANWPVSEVVPKGMAKNVPDSLRLLICFASRQFAAPEGSGVRGDVPACAGKTETERGRG